jgi:regulator of protease activity HflC (stomatin/prohibitin superfamily)
MAGAGDDGADVSRVPKMRRFDRAEEFEAAERFEAAEEFEAVERFEAAEEFDPADEFERSGEFEPSDLAEPDLADATRATLPPWDEPSDRRGVILPPESEPAGLGGTFLPPEPEPARASAAFRSPEPEPAQPSAAFHRPAPEPSGVPQALAQPGSTVPITEHAATTLPGWPVTWGVIAGFVVGILITTVGGGPLRGLGVAVIALAGFACGGLTPIAPGEARVVQLLGRYTGTMREPGLQWVSPVTKRHKISTRIRNHETGLAKVNDAEGNPIEIAAVVVWQVTDTAKAVFGVDNFTSFVAIQAETAVRRVAGSYPYDSHDGKMSLLQNAEEITAALAAEIAERVRPAGVEIIEARLTRLAYAPEVATVMLRRQQAGAVVAARQRIVDGAVGMVEAALDRLAADGTVELDEERKATMVSNLLVVLCSEHPTQPVINTGTLYQ